MMDPCLLHWKKAGSLEKCIIHNLSFYMSNIHAQFCYCVFFLIHVIVLHLIFIPPSSLHILQFNCFLLMPVVDKLPVLLREDLESAFRDDLDNVFDITHLQQSLGQRKRDLEIELRRVSYVFRTFLGCRIIGL